jgi:hypothetical protein
MAKKSRDDDALQDESGGSIPVNDAWTGMLAISLLALMIGAGFLFWDWYSFPDKLPNVPSVASKQPGAPPVMEKKEPPPPVGDDKKKDEKKDEKKDDKQ